jgi:hypothetical protein
MASSAGQKPLILSAGEADLQCAEAIVRLAENRIKPPNLGSSSFKERTLL